MKSSKRPYVFLIFYCIAWQAIAVPLDSTAASLLGAFLSAVSLFATSSIAAPISPLNAYTDHNGVLNFPLYLCCEC
jgi:hypothetical protein